jgi:multiple sugar transport system permease protein
MTVATREIPITRARVAWYQRKSTKENARKALVFILLAAGAVLFIAPVLWMVSSSLKPNQLVFDGKWIPSTVLWSNYSDAMTAVPFGTYFKNTGIVTGFSVVGALLSSSLVAYSFARLRWPGRDLVFGIVLITMLLPGVVTFIPQYILFSKLGWTNTLRPLIVPTYFGNAFYIFLLRQFYRGIPMELSDAARIDGANELRIWWQVIMPLSKPALAAVGIFAFTGAWEDYFGPLIYLDDPDKFTLQLGLKAFESASGGGLPLWNLLMAAGLVVMIPVIIAFFIGQKYFIEGVTLTGLKG